MLFECLRSERDAHTFNVFSDLNFVLLRGCFGEHRLANTMYIGSTSPGGMNLSFGQWRLVKFRRSHQRFNFQSEITRSMTWYLASTLWWFPSENATFGEIVEISQEADELHIEPGSLGISNMRASFSFGKISCTISPSVLRI